MKIWFMIGFILLLSGVINLVIADKEEVYKKCYDSFSNEIIGEKCIEQRLVEPYYFINNIIFGLFIINFFCTPIILCLIQDYLNKRESKR